MINKNNMKKNTNRETEGDIDIDWERDRVVEEERQRG